ncbi:ABC transporter substrate-binding protein [Paenibacillus sp. UNC451MF]|uniref:ABC transporter substrate-binding protein n=1 Tax=Paenibacillus sp. UNC451MF TaxID=1449063 RepID=UPI00048F161C|nr:extracellular solute-binding protein [Paenibacillus sp. UNC451MF]
MIRQIARMTSVLMCFVFAGCASQNAGPDSKSAEAKDSLEDVSKPVTIKVLRAASMSDELFQTLVVEPMAKKYPNITIELQNGKLEELIAAGETPDVLTYVHNNLPILRNLDLVEDMTPLLKKHNYDLGRFNTVYLDALRVNSEKGELYAIPYFAQTYALFYNKDLFDKFGVPYPKDGMTWEDATELGKKMTRIDNGQQYQGLNIEKITRISFPWSPTLIEKDKTTQKDRANVNNDTWKEIFNLGYRIQTIPGNYPNKDFYKGEVAMFAVVGDAFQNIKKVVEEQRFRVGVAQYPNYKELPNTYGMVDEHVIVVTKQSQHKDAAMKVVEVLTSNEVQMMASKSLARLSPLADPELQKQFGTEYLKDVDVRSIFKSQPAPGIVFHPYYQDARKLLDAEYAEVLSGQKDVNTALRVLEEKINKMLLAH